MIRFGLRLTFRGGREAAVRLIITAVAVALGVGMLLTTLAGVNAVNSQNARFAWFNTGVAGTGSIAAAGARAVGGTGNATGGTGNATGGASTAAPDPVWWLLTADDFGGQLIARVDLAATGPRSPLPPGITRLPGPGQFDASPALSKLLRSTPANQLGDRFPGRQIGTIGPAALPAPNSLIIIIGHTASQLSGIHGAEKVTSIAGTVPSSCGADNCLLDVGTNANGIDLILSVVALALLFPVLIFIAAATRLSAARREQRFAAMRLAGAAPRQVSVISAVESTVAAVAGTAAGFGLFFLLRTPAAAIPFTGEPFFPADLSLSLAGIMLVAVGVPVAAAVAARLALRRVHISPLGVSRRVTPRAPSAYRVIPLLAGLGELIFFVGIGRPATTNGQIEAYLPGFLLIMAGLVIAGPWLTMIGSRVMARRASRPAALIAARRLADNPQAGFRAISGLILALFVTSVSVGVITTMNYNRGPASGSGTAASRTLVDEFADRGPGSSTVPPVPAAVLTELRSIRGVRGVTEIHANPFDIQVHLGPGFSELASLVSCAQLSRTPALGRCAPGAAVAAIPGGGLGVPGPGSSQAAHGWAAAAISPQRLKHLRIQSIAVSTDGSAAAIERVRTALDAAYPDQPYPVTTIGDNPFNSTLAGEQQLASVVILVSLPIAGCTLAVSVAGGLSDRKRPFSLLRLTGVPLSLLRRVVALESAVPLLIVAVIATGMGFLAAQLFLTSQLHYSLRPPGLGYYLIVFAGLAASLGIIGSTLPLLSRITGPETARNE